MKDCVHLHVHSHYSMLDGGITIKNLVKKAAENNMQALALTDHGNMFGAVEFYLACKAAGIKPIVGYEAYMAPRSRTEKGGTGISESSFHLTLLARNEAGYKNLMKLATIGYREGYYYRPRIDKEVLSNHSGGLICLSGCLASETSDLLQEDRVEDAMNVIDDFRHIFGPDHFYLEIQENSIMEQNVVNEHLLKIAKDTGLPLVATNDIHYLNEDDHSAHDVLLCIGTGKKQADKNRLRFEENEFYFKTPEQMYQAFNYAPDAVSNTLQVAEMVDLKIDFDTYHHPVFKCPETQTPDDHIREMATVGLHERYSEITPEISERFEYELKILARMGFASYLLIVWDIVREARENNIPVGPGRGSAVGSLICYCLYITDLDPFKYDLIFERFINPGRNEMPDIDLDFCKERRGETIDYVTKKYGRECVCQIITFNTMAAKQALKDVGRVLDVPLSDMDKLTKKVPEVLGIKLEEALEEADFNAIVNSNPEFKQVVDHALRLEGLARNPGVHAAGVIIADRDVSDYCPLYVPPGTEDVTTQYEMKMSEKVGLLKVDFLGLATLTLIHYAAQNIRNRHGVDFIPGDLDLEDAPTYEMLGRGEAKGIFQFESEGMRQLLRDARPNCLEDLIALNAMYRPGPMENIPSFVARKHGREEIVYLHPMLEPILSNTYGIIVYQEQVIRIANVVGGFSLPDGDSLRKAMGKKDQDLMDKFEGQFVDGAVGNGFSREQAIALWDQLKQFAEYGFNKSHAAAYAFLAFQTAWLKAHYPREFMAALLTIEIGAQSKVSEYIQECQQMGIDVLPPDVNESGAAFTPLDEGIRFGLEAIKGVGSKAVESIVAARAKHESFISLFDFCEKVNLQAANRTTIEALIKSGALDRMGEHRRSQMLLVIDDSIRLGAEVQADRASGQMNLFGGGEPGTNSDQLDFPMPDVDELDKLQLLALEKEYLGFFVTGHPLEEYADTVKTFSNATTKSLAGIEEGASISMIGIVGAVRSSMSRRGRILRVMFEDLDGLSEVSIFSEQANEAGEGTIAEGRILLLRGKVQIFRDQPDIRVDKVIPIEKVHEELARRLVLHLGNGNANGNGAKNGNGNLSPTRMVDNQIAKLRKILRRHRGTCQVVLDIPLEDGRSRALLMAGEDFCVSPDQQFRDEIDALLGKGSLKFSG
ncbi:MAG: DNA polymerase III subunit alpha [Planctomycetota bacterium]|nr:DNA polymerase III subunit alpha [Planctomycetota bacterium]